MDKGTVKPAIAGLVALLILLKPAIVVFFPGFIYTSDLESVLLMDGCIGCTTQTVFVFCLLEILVSVVLLKSYVLPWFFGVERWKSYDELKRQKMVGFFVKIIVRVGCLVQILALVTPYFSISDGLFEKYNMKRAYQHLVNERTATTCGEAGMDIAAAVALRAWTFTRDDMMAVMAWELAFIPDLPLDAWLHHLFVILGVAIGSDPQVLGGNTKLQPLIDAVSFFLVLGAAFAALVEAAVLMYHFSAPKAEKQAKWMIVSMAIQAVLILAFFVVLPVWIILWHLNDFGGLAIAFILVLAFLAAVEVKMLIVKWAIVKSARRKAQRQAASAPLTLPVAEETFMVADKSADFNHDLDTEAKRMRQMSGSPTHQVQLNENEA